MAGIRAPRAYNPGDLIYTEEAFAHVLRRKQKDERCDSCFKESKDLIECSGCSAIKYCGQECMAKSSSEHKRECAKMHLLDDDGNRNFLRMAANVIFKVQGKDWKTVTRNVMGTDVSFDDINSDYEEMTKNPRLVLLWKELLKPLRDFVGEENMPEEEQLVKIIGKVKCNAASLSSNAPDLFCFGMDMFEHECIPNANIQACNNVLKVWAIKRIEASEKITVSHRNLLTPRLPRSPLSEDSLKVCTCTECSLPYGKSVLTKIIDESKAYTVIRLTEKVLNIADVLSDFDLEKDFRLRHLVDDVLEKQVGVLDETNALHLKLMAIKAMMIEGTEIQRKMYLIELEKIMSKIFGEYYLELDRIYKALIMITYNMGNMSEAGYYLQKLKKTSMHEQKEADE